MQNHMQIQTFKTCQHQRKKERKEGMKESICILKLYQQLRK